MNIEKTLAEMKTAIKSNEERDNTFTASILQEAYNIIQEYKELEEQGLLLRLPCKVGDTVWWINSCYTFNGVKRVDEEIVKSFVFDEDGLTIVMSGIAMGEYGKTVFLTREEAEQALAEMKGE